jgi:hypothetical protein
MYGLVRPESQEVGRLFLPKIAPIQLPKQDIGRNRVVVQ